LNHGTITMATTGGCSCGPCRSAQTRYVKQWRLARQRGHEFQVSSLPTRRKIGALWAIGVTSTMIADEAGYSSRASISNTMKKPIILARTEERFEQAYRALEMTIVPPSRGASAARAKAKRQGWLPPLAYDDIHQGIIARSERSPKTAPRNRLDHLEVEYVLQYADWEYAKTSLSPLEKAEVVRLWLAEGRSEAELCRLTGWKEGRYRQPNTHQEAS
jgi:hypothetical protein